jgi:hypothetical protein
MAGGLNLWLFRVCQYSIKQILVLTDDRSAFYTIVFAVVEKKRDKSKTPDRCRTLHEFG